MPELPEVETIRRGLEKRLLGDAIVAVEVRVTKMLQGDPSAISNTPVKAVRRIAKVLVIDFANAYSLLVHFKMTGQLVYVKNSDIAIGGHPEHEYERPLPHRHTHIIYHLKDKAMLYYNDLRKFGWHKIVPTAEVTATLGQELGGLDIAGPAFTFPAFKDFLAKRSKRPIKLALMEQQYLAGLGNIYAAEALWQAKIRPDRLAQSLKPPEERALYEAIGQVIDLALRSGGSSFNSYVNAVGHQGTFLEYAQVYKKDTDCLGHAIARLKQGGRTSYYCPICQT